MTITPPALRRAPLRLAVAGLVSLALFPATVLAAGPADAAAEVAAAPGKRPRICLVLSGGGARGAAHVGVLKVLEELRVPVHCIVGTSMGALVGAAYASGMSVREMDDVIAGISTELLFKEKPPRQELSMRRKQDDYGLFFTPEIGIDGTKLTIAKGLVSGVQLETVLRQLTKAKGYRRFDELPIPFRSVATDLVTGKAVVFSEGELANVMRASMSVPGAVAPAEFDGMMLVDGMLTSNLPVETARTLQPDVIIAVNVGTPLLKREELSGILGVMGQMLSILTEQNVQQSLSTLRPADILITPELGDYSTGDFDDLAKIAPLGETATRKVADRLAALAVPAEEYAALRKGQQVEIAADTRRIDEIRFAPMKSVNPRALETAMQTTANQPLDQATLDSDMRRLYGTGSFEHVSYHFLDEPGKQILVVDAAEKSWGLNTLRFGLGLSTDFKGGAFFNVIGSYRRNWVNSLGAQWRTDLQIGQTSALVTEFYQPLTPSELLFVAPHASIERRMTDVYQGESRIASFRTMTTLAGVDVGSMFGRYGEARLGIVGGVLRPELETGPLFLEPVNSRVSVGAYTARLQLDQLDSARFPRSGWRASSHVFASTHSLGSDDEYTKWDVDGSFAYSFGEHTFNIAATLGGRLGSDPLPRYDLFQWGGFLQQSGYATGQLLGEKLRYARVMYYHRIFRGSIFEGAYGGASLEFGKMDQPLVPGSPQGWLKSASLFVAADTPLGPVYLGYGRAKDGNSSLYFFLGRPF